MTSDKAIAQPPSLVDLRRRLPAMLPRVDIGEQILEVMGRVPQFLESLTALSGGAARMADLNVTVAACLTGQTLNMPTVASARKLLTSGRLRPRVIAHTVILAGLRLPSLAGLGVALVSSSPVSGVRVLGVALVSVRPRRRASPVSGLPRRPPRRSRHPRANARGTSVTVSADGRGLVSQAGAVLL